MLTMSMLTVDLDRARRFVAQRPAPGPILHVGVVGAHYYGVPSEDSDLDLKGVHLAPLPRLLRTGEAVGDVTVTAEAHGFTGLDELVAFTRERGEKSPLPEALDEAHRARWPALEQALADALATSPLPDEPPNRAEVDAWLVQRRLRDVRVQ